MNKQIRLSAANEGISIQDYVISALNFKIKEQLSLYSPRLTIQPTNGKFTFIDLFAGIGGMRLAFESAGGKCVFTSEWDKYSQVTYFENFGEKPEGDITKIPEKAIPDHDVLIAGFPCQPFSISGVSKKNSLGRAQFK